MSITVRYECDHCEVEEIVTVDELRDDYCCWVCARVLTPEQTIVYATLDDTDGLLIYGHPAHWDMFEGVPGWWDCV